MHVRVKRHEVIHPVSRPSKTKSRQQISRAELKAYEARRAAEVRRVPVAGSATVESAPTRRSYVLSRDEEYAIIRSDMRRLLTILAILVVVLVAATIVLR